MAVAGLDRLKRKLRAIPDAARTEIRKAMEASANEVVATAKSLVPVDSGALRDSIGWTWGDAPKGSIVLGTARAGTTGNMVLTIYAGDDEAFYARWVEFGTSKAPARPFFFPSWRANRKRTRARISRAITVSAKRIAAAG